MERSSQPYQWQKLVGSSADIECACSHASDTQASIRVPGARLHASLFCLHFLHVFAIVVAVMP